MSLFKRAKIVVKASPRVAAEPLTEIEEVWVRVAGTTLRLLTWRWFDDVLSIEANRILPAMLLAIYVAQKTTGAPISKSEACRPLGIDPTKTGARYIAMAEEHGLVEIEENAFDGRTDGVRLTESAIEMIEKDLEAIYVKELGIKTAGISIGEERTVEDVIVAANQYCEAGPRVHEQPREGEATIEDERRAWSVNAIRHLVSMASQLGHNIEDEPASPSVGSWRERREILLRAVSGLLAAATRAEPKG